MSKQNSTVKPPKRGVIRILDCLKVKTPSGYFNRNAKVFEMYDSEEHLNRWEQAQDEEEQAKIRAQIPPRKPEPKGCDQILTPSERQSLRVDPELVAMTASEAEIDAVCTPAWLTYPPDYFITQMFDDSDLLQVTVDNFGPKVTPLSEIKRNLSAYSKIGANPLRIGEEPPRKFLVAAFSGEHWKRISFLMRTAELTMLIHCAADAKLEGWFSVRGWPKEKLAHFARQIIRLDGEVTESARMPARLVRNAIGTAYLQLHRAGFLRDQQQLKPRNFVLYWHPPNNSSYE
jgi:hypothetical protein